MKYKILIGCMLCLFSFIPKGAANLVLNPYTSQEISADSIIERVMTFAPSYESIVSDYRANLYIKGKMNIQKKNFILRYVPSMFRLQKGVREYLLETYSDLHYTAPNIYDQKVKASQGTVRGNRGLPGLLEYFSVNIYSSSLLNDERLLSPLAKNGQKYYKYRIDSVMGDPNNLDYRIRFIPRTKSDQLVGGYMIVSSNVWSVREIRFSGRSELITFTCWIKMGEVGKKDEFLPIRYDVEALFKFLGNKVDGNYTASLDYKSIELKERKVRKKEKKKYNLSESFSLQCDTNAYKTDASTFGVLRPIPLSEGEKQLYKDYTYRRDTVSVQQKTKSQAFWGTMGDLMVEDYKFNLSNIGSVRFSPFINPLLFSYSGSNGLSYRQDFRYNRIFRGDKWLRIVPKLGYNFTRKEFYWSLNADFEYWPQKRGFFRLSVGNGNRIYSSKMLDELKAMPDSIFNFDLIHLDYFKDLYFNFRHSFEITNGLDISLGFSAHKRTAVEKSRFVITGDYPMPPPEFMERFRNTYISFAPRIRVEWTPALLPVILIQKTGFLMIRFKLLFPDDFLDPGKHLIFRKDIARKGKVVGITTVSQPEFFRHRRQFPVHLISDDVAQHRTGRRSLRQMPAHTTQLAQHFRYILRITDLFESLLHPRTAYGNKEIVDVRLQDIAFSQMGTDVIDDGMLTPESRSGRMHIYRQ